jgi:peptidoglycan hydrolase-like protein with peptidoglycan-binding domain
MHKLPRQSPACRLFERSLSSILVPGEPDRVDPDKWRPLIMSFQQFYGLTPRLQPSRQATIPESAYRFTVPKQQTEDSKFARIE